jgi:hypothetical protein
VRDLVEEERDGGPEPRLGRETEDGSDQEGGQGLDRDVQEDPRDRRRSAASGEAMPRLIA